MGNYYLCKTEIFEEYNTLLKLFFHIAVFIFIYNYSLVNYKVGHWSLKMCILLLY